MKNVTLLILIALVLPALVLLPRLHVPPVPTGVANDPRKDAPSDLPGKVSDDAPAGVDEVLPVVGSLENLKNLLQRAAESKWISEGGVEGGVAVAEAAGSTAKRVRQSQVPAPVPAPTADAADFSRTNIQVQGVDEGDVVKTDGKYIYQVNNRRVIMAQAYPAEEMRIAGIIDFGSENLQPFELYVDDKYLAVLGNAYAELRPDRPEIQIYPPPPPQVRSTVKLLIYDITDRETPRKVREVEIEGQYLSSRKVGSALYLVANRHVDYHIMQQIEEGGNASPVTPSYRDSAAGGGFVAAGYEDIRYFPDSPEPSYLIIAGLDLDRPEQEMKVSTYLGAGQTIYASAENLYVAVTRYDLGQQEPEPRPAAGLPPAEAGTVVYRFALDGGQVNYRAKGEVPGTVLNQFSMDEHEDHFRIATTRGDIWRTDEHTSRNNVYILDQALEVAGRIEDIAPGERIYSVRFMGDRAYMVTFKTVDPLFVLDLGNPRAPKVLGALKIPGYSDYLHPYDENHILGFGKDTIEMGGKGPRGGDATMAYYQGMKIALFDVTDVERPVEKFKEIIGDRGTDSELLQNHKALLFSREKDLLVFPVTLREVRRADPAERERGLAYGEFAFQGAYVYRIDLAGGFDLRGRITHLSDEDYLKAGQSWCGCDSDRNVERSLYIEDTLYTLSRGMIKAHDLGDLAEKNSLVLAESPGQEGSAPGGIVPGRMAPGRIVPVRP